MKSKEMFAKMLALQKMRDKARSESMDSIGNEIKAKKMKVVVEAPDQAGLVKGLDKAKALMAAKLGASAVEDEGEESAEEGMELSDMMDEASYDEGCEVCGGEGCPLCEAKEAEDLEELA